MTAEEVGQRGPSVADLLRYWVEKRPDSRFLLFGGRSLSYSDVARQSRALAVALHHLGVEPGDRVALDLPNWPEFVISALAAAELGAVIVPLSPAYAPRELQFMLRHSEASVAITAERYEGVDYLELFESLLVELPDLQYLVTVGKEDLWYDDRIFQFEDLVSSGMGREFRPQPLASLDELFSILYTSGTTGKPKGVMLSHRNLVRTAAATAAALELSPSDVTLCSVPLSHIFGLTAALLTGLVSGGGVVLQERFEPRGALDLVERHGVTVYHGVPTMFVMQLREPGLAKRDLDSIRTGIVAGAPVSPELVDRARRELVPQLEIAYGLTETSPTVSITRPEDPAPARSESVGRVLDEIEVEIRSEEGEPVPTGSVGELVVRGFNVMLGYFRQPSETAAAFTEDGFLRTGDLATLDAEGYLHIVGRMSDVIIRGGYNVHPKEVEDHLRSHPAVLDVVVVGVPNEVLGELVCACVRLVEGALITEDELREYCGHALSDYKVPDLVRRTEVFPMTPNGKVRRRELARLVRTQEAASRHTSP
ncbi:MAG: class I adenylate-forming enzyme family protein [Gemmatimonadota bacterium]